MKHHKNQTLTDNGFCNLPAMGLPGFLPGPVLQHPLTEYKFFTEGAFEFSGNKNQTTTTIFLQLCDGLYPFL
jgi:hypothetical protein